METRYNLLHWHHLACCELHRRTELMHEIIKARNADDLREMLANGWDLDASVTRFSCGERESTNRPLTHHQLSCITALDNAASSCWLQGVHILLTAGAKWSARFRNVLSLCLEKNHVTKSFAFFNIAMRFSTPTDINTRGHHWCRALLWEMVCHASSPHGKPPSFLVEYLDLFYQHSGDVNVEYDGSRLLHCHSNSLQWLIRHGGDISHIKLTYLNGHFIPRLLYTTSNLYVDVPLILLRAGWRLPHTAQRALRAMRADITAGNGYRESGQAMEAQLAEVEKQEPRCTFRKRSFPEYLARQVADLQEFSDESLNIYPQHNPVLKQDTRHFSQYAITQIDTVLEFLSEPQSLQWYSRRCVRENLVSLQPSVVKTLPIPAVLKRHVLCHEL